MAYWAVDALRGAALGAMVLAGAGCLRVGNVDKTCREGESCQCDGIGNCRVGCPEGGCDVLCEGTGNCLVECPGGDCTVQCEGTGNCIIEECSGGDCTVQCEGTGNCIIEACSGGCSTVCPVLGNCVCHEGCEPAVDASVPDGSTTGDAGACPAEPPFGESCSGEQTCDYGQECCCGECHASTSCTCASGSWSCFATDACLIPGCPDGGADAGADAASPDGSAPSDGGG
ncbi:MAG: hypothetical protein ACODAG_01270 [Myxococcota bacterium]